VSRGNGGEALLGHLRDPSEPRRQITSDSSNTERERLILEHLPQVRLIARQIRKRLPTNVSLEDLISAGTLGLIAAIDHFDASRNTKLKTYAEFRIRGAIIDSLRRMDCATRKQRQRSKQLAAAVVALQEQFDRVPTEEEMSKQLNLSLEQYRAWQSDVGTMPNAKTLSETSERDLLTAIKNRAEELPYQIFERSELQRFISQTIEIMPAAKRLVLRLYYYNEMSLREIAQLIHRHPSRVSQIKSQGLIILRSQLQKYWPARGLKSTGRGSSEGDILFETLRSASKTMVIRF